MNLSFKIEEYLLILSSFLPASIYLSIYLSISFLLYRSLFFASRLSIYQFFAISLSLSLSVSLHIYLSVSCNIAPSFSLHIYLSFFFCYLSLSLSVFHFTSIYLSIWYGPKVGIQKENTEDGLEVRKIY